MRFSETLRSWFSSDDRRREFAAFYRFVARHCAQHATATNAASIREHLFGSRNEINRKKAFSNLCNMAWWIHWVCVQCYLWLSLSRTDSLVWTGCTYTFLLPVFVPFARRPRLVIVSVYHMYRILCDLLQKVIDCRMTYTSLLLQAHFISYLAQIQQLRFFTSTAIDVVLGFEPNLVIRRTGLASQSPLASSPCARAPQNFGFSSLPWCCWNVKWSLA